MDIEKKWAFSFFVLIVHARFCVRCMGIVCRSSSQCWGNDCWLQGWRREKRERENKATSVMNLPRWVISMNFTSGQEFEVLFLVLCQLGSMLYSVCDAFSTWAIKSLYDFALTASGVVWLWCWHGFPLTSNTQGIYVHTPVKWQQPHLIPLFFLSLSTLLLPASASLS